LFTGVPEKLARSPISHGLVEDGERKRTGRQERVMKVRNAETIAKFLCRLRAYLAKLKIAELITESLGRKRDIAVDFGAQHLNRHR